MRFMWKSRGQQTHVAHRFTTGRSVAQQAQLPHRSAVAHKLNRHPSVKARDNEKMLSPAFTPNLFIKTFT